MLYRQKDLKAFHHHLLVQRVLILIVVLNRLAELFKLTQIQDSSLHRIEGGGEGDKKKTEFTYDKNGNLIKKTEIDGDEKTKTWTYYYDYENKLIMVVKQGEDETKTISFKYDSFGRRIEKKVEEIEDGKVKIKVFNYVYDNEDIILEYLTKSEDGKTKTETTRYIHGLGIDEPLAIERKGEIYYYHADGLGSITALTDKKQKMVESYTYDSFGSIKRKGDKVKNTFTYTGREWDKEIGLYYYRMRYYDSQIGRFLQKDPFHGYIDNPQTLNPYPYVGNNPINFVDPWGLDAIIPLGRTDNGRMIYQYVHDNGKWEIIYGEPPLITPEKIGRCYLKTLDTIAKVSESIPQQIRPTGNPYPGLIRDLWRSLLPLRRFMRLP